MNKNGKIVIGVLVGAGLGSGFAAPFNLSVLGAPIGAILLTGILLEIHNRNQE